MENTKMIADLLTKSMGPIIFRNLRNMIGLYDAPELTH